MSTGFQPHSVNQKTEYPVLGQSEQSTCWIMIIALVGSLIYAYWNMIAGEGGQSLLFTWSMDQYSHGWLIPLFAVALIWMRREPFRDVPMSHRWIGVGLIAFGIALRIFGTISVVFTFNNLSLIPCILGIFVMVGGLPVLRWAGPAIVFLIFMFPLPRVLHDGITRPLQTLGSMCSSYALVTLGVNAVREGNNIFLGLSEEAMNVADQCSGLRMLTIFSGLACALALLSRDRPWWERVLIVLSAVPIALASNVIRITLTGLLFNVDLSSLGAGEQVLGLIKRFFHDFPGWIMMLIGLGLLYLEMAILSNIVIDVPEEAALGLETNAGQQPKIGTESPS